MPARRKFLAMLVLSVVLPLMGCGDHEAEKAKAFAEFLQNRILDRPGVHIPILNEEERAAIGHFEADFAILKGYNDDLSASVREFGEALHPAPQNAPPLDLPKYKPDLAKARDFFPRASAGVDAALAKAKASRENLNQPEVVKAKYDAAFDQLVTRPANAMREIIPLAIPAMDSEIAVADFIEAHKGDIKAVGSQMQIAKPSLRKELDALLSDYNQKFAKVLESRRKLEVVVEGR